MRIMFMFFAGLNIAFFLWQTATSDEKQAALRNLETPAGIQRLQLLNEGQKDEAAKDSKQKAPSKTTSRSSGSTRGMACYTLGPFTKEVQARSIMDKLREFVAEVTERENKARVSSGYWVYLPQFENWQEARAKIMDLEARGMKDVFIMGRGKMKNAVSLGLYSSQDAADRRVEQLKRLGAKAEVEIQYTLQNQYWLDVHVQATDKEAATSLNKLADGLVGIKLQSQSCN